MEVKKTGIIRRIDDLGRLVVVKDLRRELCISEGDAFEESIVTLENGVRGVLFTPYNTVEPFNQK